MDGLSDQIIKLLKCQDENINSNPQFNKYREMIVSLTKTPKEYLLEFAKYHITEAENEVFTIEINLPMIKFGILSRFSYLKNKLLRNMLPKKIFERRYPRCQRCHYNNTQNILLNCGHIFCKNCLSYQCILSKVFIPSVDFQVKCPFTDCIYVLSFDEITQATGGLAYMYNYEINKKNICVFCGESSNDILIPTNSTTQHELILSCKNCALLFDKKFTNADSLCECLCRNCQQSRKAKQKVKVKDLDKNGCFSCKKKLDTYLLSSLQLDCGHWCHISCMKRIISEGLNIPEIGIRKLTCLAPNCKYILTNQEILEATDEKTLEDFMRKQEKLECVQFTCRKCNTKNFINKKCGIKNATCKKCHFAICWFCGNLQHPAECPDRKLVFSKLYVICF